MIEEFAKFGIRLCLIYRRICRTIHDDAHVVLFYKVVNGLAVAYVEFLLIGKDKLVFLFIHIFGQVLDFASELAFRTGNKNCHRLRL